MNELALFAGAGGGILGGKLLGWKTICAVEYDKHARSILIARQNDGCLDPFPIWDDVQTFNGKPWRGLVDVVSGGFPCQDISSAGDVAGITGSRSGLWKHMARIIDEVQPQFIFAENSPMLVGRGLGTVLCDLTAMGYNARWAVLGADDFGGHHIRKRCWVLADAIEERNSSGPKSIHEINGIGRDGRGLPSKILRCAWNGRSPGLYWASEPGVARVVNGLADGVDRRNQRTGNGQVPVVAAAAWVILGGPIETQTEVA